MAAINASPKARGMAARRIVAQSKRVDKSKSDDITSANRCYPKGRDKENAPPEGEALDYGPRG
jgi:hypothetical protein